MILIIVKQPVREKYADDFPERIAPFIEGSRAEPGCISFDWYRSVDDPNLYVLVELFEDEAAGKAHTESQHFKDSLEYMPRLLSAAPEIIHTEIEGGFGDVAEIPD